jgi:hypothetical protein
MNTFITWCDENELGLPGVNEHKIRTGITQNYPDAYARSQYPHKYFNPTKATTDLDIEQKPAKYNGPKEAK